MLGSARRPGRLLWIIPAQVLLSLLLVEAAFRVALRVWPEPVWLGSGVYPANPRGVFTPCGPARFCVGGDPAPYHACDVAVDDSQGQVLIVGDSFAYGLGVRPDEAFSTLLHFPGYQRRNCARPGNDINDIQRDFYRQRQRYRPSLTIYAMVLNDFGVEPDDANPYATLRGDLRCERGVQCFYDYINLRSMNVDAYIATRSDFTRLQRLLLGSRVVSFFYRRWLIARIGEAAAEGYRRAIGPGPGSEAGFAGIARMAAASDRFLVVLFPLFYRLDAYPFEDLHRTIREQLGRRQIEFLDLLDTFRGMDYRQLIVYDTDEHPNEVAHRMAADAIRARLRELHWPPVAASPG